MSVNPYGGSEQIRARRLFLSLLGKCVADALAANVGLNEGELVVEHNKVGVTTRHDAAALILDVRGTSRHLGRHADGDIGAGDAPINDVLDALGKREHRAGDALAVGEPAQVVLHDDIHAAAGVAALGHTTAAQAIGDKHRVLPPLGLQQRLDGGRVHMLAVADDLGVGLRRSHSGTHDTGLTVMQTALAVIGMRKAAGTGVDGGDALIEASVRHAEVAADGLI